MTAGAEAARGARLTGAELSAEIRARVTASAGALTEAGRPPRLTVVVATANKSTGSYVRSIAAAASEVGIACEIVDLGATSAGEEIEATVRRLSGDPSVHGIILQTPLPAGVNSAQAVSAIDPDKDVDGANPSSLGRLAAGLPAFPPATAHAVIAVLDHHKVPLSGRHAVVVGRSTVVGKPVAHLLLDRDATVTICHSRTPNLAEVTRRADVLIAAVGRAGLIGHDHVSRNTVVIDVGMSPSNGGGLAGDVDTAVEGHVAGLTPVPGGVGPVTVAAPARAHDTCSGGRRGLTMQRYVFDFSEGDRSQRDLLGGKGTNLAEMVELGLAVPPGFTISTEACRAYLAWSVPARLEAEVDGCLAGLEADVPAVRHHRPGDGARPGMLASPGRRWPRRCSTQWNRSGEKVILGCGGRPTRTT